MKALVIVAIVASGLTGATVAGAAAKRGHHHARHHHAKKHRVSHHRAAPERAQRQPQPPARPTQPASFDGSCDFTGAVTFTPAMTTTPQRVAQHADAPGTCTGTFVDHYGTSHALDAAPVRYRADSAGDSISCAFGVDSGAGTLSFPAGDLAFKMDEYRVAATPLLQLAGRSGGSASMAVTPSPSADPVAAVQDCGGAGLKEFDLTGHLQTESALRG